MVQNFVGKVIEVKKLTEDVIQMSLEVPEDFTFVEGQYVFLKVDGKLKAYSILSPPLQKGKLDLCIKIVDGGHASEAFKKTSEGDEFEMKGPIGKFIFDSSGDDQWFVGTGTGVAPFYSMIFENVMKYPEKKFTLLFGVRHVKGLFLHDDFLELEQKCENFTYMPTVSCDTWEGRLGRVQKHLPDDCGGRTFYICGLKEMVLETVELLESRGVAKEDIHFERYS